MLHTHIHTHAHTYKVAQILYEQILIQLLNYFRVENYCDDNLYSRTIYTHVRKRKQKLRHC